MVICINKIEMGGGGYESLPGSANGFSYWLIRGQGMGLPGQKIKTNYV